MPEYRYSVIDANGRELSGTMEADSLEVCQKIIAQRGLFCIELTEASLASKSINIGKGGKFDLKALSVLCRQFSAMLSSGISVIKSLDILQVQADNKGRRATIKKVYEGVLRGQSLSEALNDQNAFPEFFISMVEAGEASGTLDKVMAKVADHYEKTLKTANKVKGAMIYPAILGTLTVVVVAILMIFVLPVFIKMFESDGTVIPLPTKILIGISNSLVNYWFVYIIVILSGWLIWMNFIKSKSGRMAWDKFKTKAPIVGKLNVTILSARFAQTLSSLIQSGIPLIKSLEITARVLGNTYFEQKLAESVEEIRKGRALSGAIKNAGVFPLMLVSMLGIGEESGTTDDVLYKTALFYDEAANTATTKLVGILEPIMIVIMALVVGFIVISIVLPMYGTLGSVN